MSQAASPEHWPPKRKQLLDWFRQEAPSLACGYEGALRLLEEKPFPGRIHFISHVVRDIANILPEILRPKSKAGKVQYHQYFDKFEKEWPNIEATGGNEDSLNQNISIDYELARKIDTLVTKHRERRSLPSNPELLLQILKQLANDNISINLRLVKDFENLIDWFQKKAHLQAKMLSPVDEAELQHKFRTFENILLSFVGEFFTRTAELDAILHQANQ
ncbi:MAG: hypothetical protein HUJ26_18225 [Planctomycetaceae bacterium]|nr:hypothetical protein [Planctomycetaceae bacterium]